MSRGQQLRLSEPRFLQLLKGVMYSLKKKKYLWAYSVHHCSILWSNVLNLLFHYAPLSESKSRSVMSDSLWPHGLYSPGNSLVQNTGSGSLSLLQGIFPTQGSNPGLLHCRWILYQLSHKGSPCSSKETFLVLILPPKCECHIYTAYLCTTHKSVLYT